MKKGLIHKRVPAGALLYVVSISLVIGLLLSFFILFISYKKLYREQLGISSDLLHNAESGINLLRTDKALARYGEVKKDLFDTGKDSVTLKYIPWGVFNVLVSKATAHHHEEQLVAMAGAAVANEEKPALYVADLDRPVSVSGDTRLTGLCYIPKAGMKPAFIEGTSYMGSKMIDGTSKPSMAQVPALDEDWLKDLMTISKRIFIYEGIGRAVLPADSMKRSFTKPTLLIEQDGTLRLNDLVLQGNIIISASRKVIIGANCRLKDVMIVSPYIRIEEGFQGQASFISSDTIVVEKKVKLAYPSSLVVVREKANGSTAFISMDEESEVSGVMLSWQKEYDMRYQPKLLLGKKTKLKGQAYCNGFLGLNSSEVAGSVYANKLLLITGSAIYENHLLNTRIDGTKLPDHFAGICFKETSTANYIAKWLY